MEATISTGVKNSRQTVLHYTCFSDMFVNKHPFKNRLQIKPIVTLLFKSTMFSFLKIFRFGVHNEHEFMNIVFKRIFCWVFLRLRLI